MAWQKSEQRFGASALPLSPGSDRAARIGGSGRFRGRPAGAMDALGLGQGSSNANVAKIAIEQRTLRGKDDGGPRGGGGCSVSFFLGEANGCPLKKGLQMGFQWESHPKLGSPLFCHMPLMNSNLLPVAAACQGRLQRPSSRLQPDALVLPRGSPKSPLCQPGETLWQPNRRP